MSRSGPYERQMGQSIVRLLHLFDARVPDAQSHARVLELVATPARWSAGHAVFNELRRRLLAVEAGDMARQWQYAFEESCCQAIYNSTCPPDPFDPSAAFFIAGQALGLAGMVGLPAEAVAGVLGPRPNPSVA